MVRDVLLGVVTGAQGLKGAVKVKTFTRAPDALGAYGALHLKDGRRLDVAALAVTPRGEAVVTFTGIVTREAAENLKGAELFVPRDALPSPGDEEFYHADLIGLAAVDGEGRMLGTVAALHNFGAGDVIELKRADENGSGGDSVHLPFTRETVPHIDLAAGRITVAVPRDDGAAQKGFVE